MVRMVVFDMAGTTVDEDNVVYKTLQKTINERQFDFTLDEVLAEGAGKEKLQAIRSILASKEMSDETLATDIFGTFLQQLEVAYQTLDVKEQRHASHTFKELKERNIYVVLDTGYNRETAESLIKKIGWEKGVHFDLLVTASDVNQNRPYPDMILLAMEKLNVQSGELVIKVGDSGIDIQEGQNAGCLYSIGITTGAHTRQQLAEANPDFIIDSLLEVIPIVDRVAAVS
jgi:phosphonatase-like hydrolase